MARARFIRSLAVGTIAVAAFLLAASSPAKPKKPSANAAGPGATSLEDGGKRRDAGHAVSRDAGPKSKDAGLTPAANTPQNIGPSQSAAKGSGDGTASPVNACARSLLALEALVRFAPATCTENADCEAQAGTCTWSYVRKSTELSARIKAARNAVRESCPDTKAAECNLGQPSEVGCVQGSCAAVQRAPAAPATPGNSPRTTRTVKPVGLSGVR